MVKNVVKSFSITLVISVILNFLLLLYTQAYDLKAWINVTFASGVIVFGVGALIYVSQEGTFDIARYGVTKVLKSIFRRKEKMQSYFSYYTENRSKKSLPIANLLFVGLLQIMASLVLLFLYYN